MQFTADDRLLWDAEAHFPGGQLQLLAHEVEVGLGAFASLNKLEQYARLKVWIGRFRFHQASQDRDAIITEEHQTLSHKVFHQLKWLSRQYEPGYIEAFRQDFSTDWSAYVTEAQEQLAQAIEAGRRARDAEAPRTRESCDDPPSSSGMAQAARLAAPSSPTIHSTAPPGFSHAAPPSLDGLKSLVSRLHLPDEGLDQFLAGLRHAIDDVGTANPELLRLVMPYREYITGEDGLGALRRDLERIQARRDDDQAHHDS